MNKFSGNTTQKILAAYNGLISSWEDAYRWKPLMHQYTAQDVITVNNSKLIVPNKNVIIIKISG